VPNIEFVLVTCGEPTTGMCLASLRNEIDESDIRVVHNVYPMSDAFNRVFESQADWAVQVDADFLFYRGFARRFSDEITMALAKERNDGLKIHALTFSLYDPFEHRNIGWCKAFQMRHVRAEGIRFKNLSGCDMALMQEFADRGYQVLRLPLNRPIGDHYLPTGEQLFSRWSEMVAKFGVARVDQPLLNLWIDRVKNHRSPLHAAALLGVFHPREERTERNRQEESAHPIRQMIAGSTPDELVARALALLKDRGLL
jgi:hypothetical protein